MARGSGGIRYYVDADTSGLQRALGGAEDRMNRLGRAGSLAFRGLATAAIAGGAAVGAGLVVSVKNATDLNEELSKAGVVFRQQGKDVQEWSKTLAASFGISRREGLAAAGVFGNMLVPMGLARKQAADMSKQMVELAGDMSSFNNASPEETLDALRAGLAGETEPLRRFGVFLNQARIEQEAMNRGLYDGEGAISAAAKAQATYALILKDTKDAQGDASRTGDQLAGGLRRLRAQADDASTTLGNLFIPPLEKGLAFINNEVMPGLNRIAGDITAIWERPGLTPAEKFEESWDAIQRTGLPSQVKQAIYDGLTAVGTQGPQFLLRGLQEAPWPAKGVLAALLIAKFGPAFKLLGAPLGRAFGGAGAAGGLGGRGLGGPVPVIVTNPGFGGVPGRPGAPLPGGPAGVATRLGPGALLGLGGLAIGGTIGVGLGVNALDKRFGLLGPSEAEARKAADRAMNMTIEAWRKGGPALQREMQKHLLVPAAPIVERLRTAANSGIAEFERTVARRGPKVRQSMDAVVNGAVAALARLEPQARRLAADSIVQMTATMEREGRATQGTTRTLVRALEREFGRLPSATRRIARDAMGPLEAFNRALSSIRTSAGDAARAVENWSTRSVNASRRAQAAAPTMDSVFGFATGGRIPGPAGAPRRILAHGNEVILNPAQQRIVGIDRIMGALRATGGVIGGDSFAVGGVVGGAFQSLLSEARAARYSQEQRGQRAFMDCSEFATRAAISLGASGVQVGWTGSAWQQSRPARGDEWAVFGFRGMNRSPRYQHMGIRVNGTWYDFGGSGLDIGDNRWDSLRVPAGLPSAPSGEPDTREATRGDGRPQPMTRAQVRNQNRAILRGGLGTPSPMSASERAGARIETRARDNDLQDARARQAGERGARAGGITNPDRIAAEGDLSVMRTRETELRQDAADVTRAANGLRRRITDLRRGISADYVLLRRTPGSKPARRQSIIRRIQNRRQQVREAIDELRGLIRQGADIQADLDYLGFEIGDLVGQIAQMPAAEPSSAPDAGGGETGPTPDQQAAIDQANARATAAEQSARAGEAFLAALRGSGDIDQPGGSVTVNMVVNGSAIYERNLGSAVLEAISGNTNRTTSVVTLRA